MPRLRPSASIRTWLVVIAVLAWNFSALARPFVDRPRIVREYRGNGCTIFVMSDESSFIRRDTDPDRAELVLLHKRSPDYGRDFRSEIRFRLLATPLIFVGWGVFLVWSRVNRTLERPSWTSSPPSS